MAASLADGSAGLVRLRAGSSERFDARFDGLKESFANAKIWALLLYIALAAVNLGTLARGFGWI